MPCETCGDTGLHFIPTFVAGTDSLRGHVVERCDACRRFPSDRAAAEASGCSYHEEDVEVFVLDEVPPDSPIARRNAQLRDDPAARRRWMEA